MKLGSLAEAIAVCSRTAHRVRQHCGRNGVCSLILAIVALGALMPGPANAVDCNELQGKSFGDALVFEVADVQGALTIAALGNSKATVLRSPLCRVRGMMTPVEGSSIQIEVWLPPKSAWNGKYVGVGNGAFLGSIMFDEMERPFARGYAVSSTDAGHISTGSDSSWAFGRPERVVDWAWRAHHLTAVASKQIIDTYYGTAPKHSYFLGCSKGGASAMMEAQRFPEDYDGILVGAPGANQTGQITSYLWTQQAIVVPGGWLSPAKINLLHRAVLKACPSQDGFLTNPAACGFDPGRLQCKAGDADTCLTAQQVTTVRKIYSGPTDENGKSLYPGLARGSELEWNGRLMGPAERPGIGASIYPNMLGYIRNVLYGQADLEFSSLQPSEVFKIALSKLGSTIDAKDSDLSRFQARGGKLIHFQGWNDPTVRPAWSPLYYEQTVATMGGLQRVQSFYRLFMGPGADHCSGGIGPNAAGGPHNGPAPTRDPQYDMLSALEVWVEQGRPPEQIIATLYQDDDPAKGVAAQRPWCPHPAIAVYSGRGDPKQASSYVCRAS